MSRTHSFLLLLLLHTSYTQKVSFQPEQTAVHEYVDERGAREKWGYVEAREGLHTFWWLYYTTHPDGYQNRPWLIWLQGGPGLSSTGLGNFAEMGPLDINLTRRNSSWVQSASVLFIDNYPESGFSYIDNGTRHSSNTEEISSDLIHFIQVFLAHNPEFRDLQLYIFGQSYGGKMAVGLSYYLQKAINRGEVRAHLKGVGIGNGWVSSIDFVNNWAPLLLQVSLIDYKGYDVMMTAARSLEQAVDAGSSEDRFEKWMDVLNALESSLDSYVDVYNFMNLAMPSGSGRRRRRRTVPGVTPLYLGDENIYSLDLSGLMDGPVREKLEVIPSWKNWTADDSVMANLLYENGDLVMPVVELVDELLKTSDVQIIVYEGQLDFVCEPKGASDWIRRLTWPGLAAYLDTPRKPLSDPDSDDIEMFVKARDNLKFYWVLKVGHAVPAEAPNTSLRMLNRIFDDLDN